MDGSPADLVGRQFLEMCLAMGAGAGLGGAPRRWRPARFSPTTGPNLTEYLEPRGGTARQQGWCYEGSGADTRI